MGLHSFRIGCCTPICIQYYVPHNLHVYSYRLSGFNFTTYMFGNRDQKLFCQLSTLNPNSQLKHDICAVSVNLPVQLSHQFGGANFTALLLSHCIETRNCFWQLHKTLSYQPTEHDNYFWTLWKQGPLFWKQGPMISSENSLTFSCSKHLYVSIQLLRDHTVSNYLKQFDKQCQTYTVAVFHIHW